MGCDTKRTYTKSLEELFGSEAFAHLRKNRFNSKIDNKTHQNIINDIEKYTKEKLTDIQKDIVGVFTGKKRIAKIQADDLKLFGTYLKSEIELDVGTVKKGAKHIHIDHFGEGKNGEVDYFDLVLIPHIIKNSKPELVTSKKTKNKNHKYEMFIDDVRYRIIIGIKDKGTRPTISFHSNRKQTIGHNATATSQGDNFKSKPESASKKDSISEDGIKIKSMVIPLPEHKKIVEWFKNNQGVDKKVEGARNGIMRGFEIFSQPVKLGLDAMTKGYIPKDADWFTITDLTYDINRVINDYRNANATIYQNASDIKEYIGTISKEDSKSLVHALGGDVKPETLTPDMKKLYTRFRNVIDKNANELVELGALKETSKIEDYLKRYYIQYIKEGHGGSSIAHKKLMARKDLTMDERIALGMIEDADFVIPKTIAEQATQIEKAKTLKIMADKFGKDEEFENSIKVSDATASDGIYKYGALQGKWVDSEVHSQIINARIVGEEIKTIEGGLYRMIDHLKVNMTVKNPVTHVYNIASNILLSGLNNDMIALNKVLWMRHKTPNRFKALVKKANKFGLSSYLDDFETTETVLKMDDENPKRVNIATTIYKNMYMTQDSKLGKKVRHLYDWEDKIFKIASFDKLLNKNAKYTALARKQENKNTKNSLTKEELAYIHKTEKQAYKESVEVYVDYSTPLPQGIRTLDKSGLMPFLHYQYKSTPATAKVMLKNPINALLMGTGALMLGASAWTNDDEELLLPEWANDKPNLFGIAEWVNLGYGYYLNAGRMIPGTKFDFEFGGIIKGAIGIMAGITPLDYDIYKRKKTDIDYSAIDNYGLRLLTMAENYLPSITLGRYMQRSVKIGLGGAGMIAQPMNKVTGEADTLGQVGLRALGVRKMDGKANLGKTQKSLNSYIRRMKKADKPIDAKAVKELQDKINRAKKKGSIKMDLSTKKKSSSFGGGFDIKF